MKRIPIGIDDFKKIIENDYYYIDKTIMIKEFWDDGEIVLITRPRRFGKTLNMSMLKYFFDNKEENKELFKNLEIYNDEEMMKYQGKYPVIYLSFRGCGASTAEETILSIKTELRAEVLRHSHIREVLKDSYKQLFDDLIDPKASNIGFTKSISLLSELIYIASGLKPIVLIDEYDNPMNNAYINGFYEDVIKFLKPFYENTLKSNNFMEKACLTGVLRVAKESIFSGLNNLKVSSILSNRYSDKFGFLEEEVKEYLDYYGIEYKMDEVKNYYNGYVIGESEIFNPWSIVNYGDYMLNNEYSSKDFWINTSSNDIVKNLMKTNSEGNKKDIEKLIKGEEIIKVIDESVVYKYLASKSDAPWSLMLFSGYLKMTQIKDRKRMALKIPNKEIRSIYQDVIVEWVSEKYDISEYNQIVDYLLDGDMESFSEGFKDLIFKTMSFFDPTGEKPENFYHGFTLGILALLIDTYEIKYNIKSNREAGKGRADILIIPKDTSRLGIVMEFKKADCLEKLEPSSKEAINQIYEKKYEEEVKSFGVKEVMKIGIGFYGKECSIVYET